MTKTKLFTIASIILILTFTQFMFAQNLFLTSAAAAPTQLKVFAGPTSVLADNRSYGILVMQLQDSRGIPARAQQDVEVRLSSSLTTIGTVDSTVTIKSGETQTTANFYTTFTPGATTITAATSGFMTAQTTVTTIGPIPSALTVYGCPSTLPADGKTYDAVIVQLQDSSGTPAKAPNEGLQITLSTSNANVTSVDPSVTIEGGKTYATAHVRANATGQATITAMASGYTSGQTTLTTQLVGNASASLKVYLGPPKIPADGDTYQLIAVQLLDAKNKISVSSQDTIVTLSSSNTAVGTTDQTVTIPANQTFALAKFKTTYLSGTTSITAAATNCTVNQATLTTVGPIPSKLAVYSAPATLPADNKQYSSIQVQLQDSRGKPAKDPNGDITVYLFSSIPEAGTVNATLTIPFGETQAQGAIYTTCAANATTITAQTSGYDPGQTKITTYLIDPVYLTVSVTTESANITSADKTTLRAYVTYNGTGPALKATLNFTSSKGGNFTTPKEEGNGYYTTTFTAPKVSKQTICNITANATKTGYISTNGILKLTIDLNSSLPKGTLNLRIAEDNGNPVTEATITAQPQTTGLSSLNSVTNATGYAAFSNILEGNYTIQIAKDGYETKTQTIQFSASRTATQTLNLAKNSSDSTPLIIGAVAAGAIAVVVVFLFIRRRRNAQPSLEIRNQKKLQKKLAQPHF